MSFTVSLSNLQVYTLPVVIFLVLIIAGVVIKLRKYKRLYHEAEDSLHMYESLYFNADEKLHAYIYKCSCTEEELKCTTKAYENLKSYKFDASDINSIRGSLSKLEHLACRFKNIDNLLYRSSFCNNVIGDLNYIKDRLYEAPNQSVIDCTDEVFEESDDLEEHSIEITVDDDSITENFQEVISFLSDFLKAVDEGKLNNFYEEKGITDSIQIRVNTHKYKNLIH